MSTEAGGFNSLEGGGAGFNSLAAYLFGENKAEAAMGSVHAIRKLRIDPKRHVALLLPAPALDAAPSDSPLCYLVVR